MVESHAPAMDAEPAKREGGGLGFIAGLASLRESGMPLKHGRFARCPVYGAVFRLTRSWKNLAALAASGTVSRMVTSR